MKIKKLLPDSNDPVEKEFKARILGELGQTLYDASENVLFDKDKKNKAMKAALATLLLTMMPLALPMFSMISMDLTSE